MIWIRDAIIAIILGIVFGLLTGCQSTDVESRTMAPQAIQSTDVNAADSAGTTTAAEETVTGQEPVSEPERTELHETPTATGSWHDSTKSHDITVDSILKYDDNAIYNFNDTVAVGVCGQNSG